MDKLKNIIESNRELFDSAEPSKGHFDRFEQMLNQESKQNRTIVWPTVLKVASIAILVVLSGLYIAEHLFLNNTKMAKNNNPSEFYEAKQYYSQQVDHKIGQIESMSQFMTKEQKKMLVEEMTQMDAMYKKLQKDYKTMPDDPRIIQAMLQHYQMKMDILNRIVNDLQNVQQLKTPDHESTEI